LAKKAAKKIQKRVDILSDRVHSMFPGLIRPDARELVLQHALHSLDERHLEGAMNDLLNGM
jgi:hypothetical protein